MGGKFIPLKTRLTVLASNDYKCITCGIAITMDGNKYARDYACCNLWVPEKYWSRGHDVEGYPCTHVDNLKPMCRGCVMMKSDLDTRNMTLKQVRSYINTELKLHIMDYNADWIIPEDKEEEVVEVVLVKPKGPSVIKEDTTVGDAEDARLLAAFRAPSQADIDRQKAVEWLDKKYGKEENVETERPKTVGGMDKLMDTEEDEDI